MGVVDGATTGDVLVDADEALVDDEAADLLAVVADPRIVLAPMVPNRPTPIRALIAAPVVRRFSRRMAASRARTLACVVSLVSMAVSLEVAAKSALRETWELAVNVNTSNARHGALVTRGRPAGRGDGPGGGVAARAPIRRTRRRKRVSEGLRFTPSPANAGYSLLNRLRTCRLRSSGAPRAAHSIDFGRVAPVAQGRRAQRTQ
jgi:hypothetical protein